MWTAAALRSEAQFYAGKVWRLVEYQYRAATVQLTDNAYDQARLEELLEALKPPRPKDCEALHYLLSTPFRYAPCPHGSRFRRAGQNEGAFYAAEEIDTAIAEQAFYFLLFYSETASSTLPQAPLQRTAFACAVKTDAALDLTRPPLVADERAWTDPIDYAACQDFADRAREAGVALIRSRSVRDPEGLCNVTALCCAAFDVKAGPARDRHILEQRHFRFALRRDRVLAEPLEPPFAAREFEFGVFSHDPRIAAWIDTIR